MRIENRIQAFEWYHFEWPWLTLSDLAKYSIIIIIIILFLFFIIIKRVLLQMGKS